MEFASTTGVSTLFHYCPYVPERFADLIARNRIYLSDTKNFNDPWDCRPCFDTSRLDDPAYADKVVNYFYRAARNQTPHIPEEWHKARAVSLRADMAALRAAMVQASDMEAEIAKRYRVFCLTTHPKNILMWSHYAENHTHPVCATDCLLHAVPRLLRHRGFVNFALQSRHEPRPHGIICDKLLRNSAIR